MNVIELIADSPIWRQTPLAIVANLVVMIAFTLIAAAIVIDFVNYHGQSREVARSGRSWVETGSMTAFFVAYYTVIRLRWLELDLPASIRRAMVVLGIALVVFGVVFNIYGRVVLKAQWSNQIMIYEDSKLLTGGPFAVVRHPLYASLIWIFIGGSLIYANLASLFLTLAIFVPMMYVRAKKEDELLLASFGGEFEQYRNRTGMFIPRLGR